MTSVTESKLRKGHLRLTAPGAGTAVEYACQATSVIIASTYKDDGDAQEVLCGETLAAATTVSKSLKLTAIQDFDDPTGLMRFLRQYELQTVGFAWQANPKAEIASGECQVRLGDWGGDVGKRLTHGPELPITSLVWSDPVPATGATAGTPGTWTPAMSTPPATVADLIAGTPGVVTASPATAWAAGESVRTLDDAPAHWDGTTWVAGVA